MELGPRAGETEALPNRRHLRVEPRHLLETDAMHILGRDVERRV
jgi:hypothetical protein